MTQFNENFYTDDFDQEMLNFLKKNFKYTNELDGCPANPIYLKYSIINEYFWTSDYKPSHGSKQLTKQQFKEKIGMTTNTHSNKNTTFTKDMLVSGEHVVEFGDGDLGLVLASGFVCQNCRMGFDDINYDLTYDDDDCDLDIVKVYKIKRNFILNNLSTKENLTLLWERETPAQKEKRLAKEAAFAEVERLEKELEKVKKILAELEE
jgi:hypothetical protein